MKNTIFIFSIVSALTIASASANPSQDAIEKAIIDSVNMSLPYDDRETSPAPFWCQLDHLLTTPVLLDQTDEVQDEKIFTHFTYRVDVELTCHRLERSEKAKGTCEAHFYQRPVLKTLQPLVGRCYNFTTP